MPGIPGRFRIINSGPYQARSNDMLFCDSSGGAFDVVLPLNVTPGMPVRVKAGVSAAANPVTVKCNGQTIMGVAQDMVLDGANLDITFVHDGATWRI